MGNGWGKLKHWHTYLVKLILLIGISIILFITSNRITAKHQNYISLHWQCPQLLDRFHHFQEFVHFDKINTELCIVFATWVFHLHLQCLQNVSVAIYGLAQCRQLVRSACMRCHGTKCLLLTEFFLLLSLCLTYFSPRRGYHMVLKFCMGF